ncbi:AAA family ATPase [Catenulispora sp. NF23]|uniref:AAA family ATPase n=1 Tax=Catenulispora pinistramenti TaxID=2705254 RepID=A0ABS5L4A7_9ACTN|nr:LuxR family transcriptional regulator [Catenulispora pinistramenti]MBS2536926.1 AAA family ATPase [Catenulispora pinistramenti]MBS2553149.1 AAA family ATPase [Catenulispora pinistramenti]
MSEFPHTLVGRGAEIETLTQALVELAAGRGSCAWIEGDAGIGKSHLVAELVDRATGQGHPVLIGHAEQLMQTFPLRAVADALAVTAQATDPARAAVTALLGGVHVDGVSYTDPVRAAAERMIEIVERTCAERPLVLVLEDLHWADEASLALLDRLSGETDQIPLLLVLTTRPVVPGEDSVRKLIADRAARRLDLAPLGGADVRALAGARLATDPGPRLWALLESAAGSPFHLHEIVDQLDRDDLRTLPDGRVELASETPRPGRLAESLGRRMDGLDPDHRQAIRLAALLGDRFGADDLASVMAGDPDPALRSAAAAGLVDLADDRVRFRHELIRQVLVSQLPAALRGGLHDHIARTLAAEDHPDTVVAGHLLATGDPLSGWALRWLADRPDAALYTAPGAYADLLTRAMSASPAPQLRAALVRQLLLVLFWLGRDEEVIAWADEAIAGTADPDLTADLRIKVLRSLARRHRFDEALRVVAPSVEDPGTSPMWRARAAAWSATAQPYVGGSEEAEVQGTWALELATSVGDPLGIAYAHTALAAVVDEEHAMDHIRAVLAVPGDEPEAQDLRFMMTGNLVVRATMKLGDRTLEPMLDEILAAAERAGSHRTPMLQGQAAAICFDHGQWDEALIHIAQLDSATARQPLFAYLWDVRAAIAYRRGELEEGARILRAAGVPEFSPEEDLSTLDRHLVPAAALREETAGRLDQALTLRMRFLDLPVGPEREGLAPYALELIRLARALGAEDVAQAAAVAVAEVFATPGLATRLTIDACQAVVAADPGRLQTIAEKFLAGDWPMYAAFTFEEAAAAWAAAGETPTARTDFLRAAECYDRLGADWDIRRATARFRPYGIRRGTQASPRTARTGWEALTATELRIGKLVAQGYANPDIARELMISRNTVQTHVSNMLAKLGKRSRTELAREIVLRSRESI